MGRTRPWRIAAGVAVGVGIAVAIPFLLAKGPSADSESAARAHAGGPTGCADRLLKDWSDGRIDGAYPVTCYRETIRKLPTDLRVYSSAEEDIRQAMSARIVQAATSGRRGTATTDERQLAEARR
jgi:hypothetical protein